ncbi:MAG TPA: hypothetical protein DCE41_29575 [Cytophagales bacterium]|nr:hypothetical protein [Cytophagales bacterium]HAA21497.1 hypothetical protein [Cytophagales bacterium]HAP64630.1 hypothetical protein [Cytophagales bacterium]
MKFTSQTILGLATALVLFACDAKAPSRNSEEFARARAGQEVKKITAAQVVEATFEQGRAVRDNTPFELPRINSKTQAQDFFSYDTIQWAGKLDPKLEQLLQSYAYQYETGVEAQDNVQGIGDELIIYSYPTDSGVHVVTYTKSEIILAIP